MHMNAVLFMVVYMEDQLILVVEPLLEILWVSKVFLNIFSSDMFLFLRVI